MSDVAGSDKQGLVFEIISARISEEIEERKHVIYTLQVRFISGNDDLSPSVIERRYTHFLNLYNDLRKEQPQLMASIAFPKKVLLGNFDNELISTRSTGFESLLKHITMESKLRSSNSLLKFLQEVELLKAKDLLDKKDHDLAYPILENNFKLLNKVFTDRSPAVLLALCRLLACTLSIPGMPHSLKWADLTLHRYEGVSDSDLLQLYVPLLQTCARVWWQNGRNKDELEQRLATLQKQGVKVGESMSLMDAVNSVEEKIFPLN
ncbi:sorting nexin-21 isoform X1 [Anoplophora glabripennis]|uniref:sorting nexin-21 isoform X1 n=1 Tax=Anoplophora glabripennis TaxID=217634 RepID=UPI00087486F1|nr:sorting nexin-21 isoform X1 [Anoplophora glabripennis]